MTRDDVRLRLESAYARVSAGWEPKTLADVAVDVALAVERETAERVRRETIEECADVVNRYAAARIACGGDLSGMRALGAVETRIRALLQGGDQ